ncbi:MAG: TetR/AcrR family transcriptional regulator, partial [Lysobacter sp.]|nr:TetR/AcrR family transcriptional regulator [Lysobacter sp.]
LAALDEAHAARTLREGLAAALRRDAAQVDALARLLSAAFDRAALEIDAGTDAGAIRAAMRELLTRAIA